MVACERIHATGLYPDEFRRGYEAWLVDLGSGEKVLLSSCKWLHPENRRKMHMLSVDRLWMRRVRYRWIAIK